jgi:hypothetical protein
MTELLRRALRRLETVAESSFATVGSTLSRHYGALSHPSPRA